MPFDHQAFLKQLTQRPGIYQMFAADGQLLYVGKAKNLRKRVSSYFRKTGLTPKTRALVQRIANIQVTVTETEVEALLLEQNLIKQERPPYNILLRDDKSYPYVFLSDRDTFPRLAMHRGSKRLKGSYYGPYPSVQAVRDSLNFLQKVFKVRQCEDSFFNNRSRPCLQYQIKRCTAPCVNFISAEQYREDVRHTQMFLEGKSDKLIRELEVEMDKAAADQAYEQAAALRDQIISLRKLQAEQVIEAGRGNVDVIAGAISDTVGCVHLLYIRQGRIVGSRNFYPKIPLAGDVSEMLAEFIPRFYMAGKGDIPTEVITSVAVEDHKLLSEALSLHAEHQVKLRSDVRTSRAKWVELAERAAEQNLAGHLAAKQNLLQRFQALQTALGLSAIPERIECFDISHSGGEATVASCVVFDSNGPLKSDYRRFNIEGIVPGDDYAAMEQALNRRYTRLKKNEGKLPDLLLIDGGRGQLRKAVEVLAELAVADVLVVGVAKGVTRKPGFETLMLAGSEKQLELPPTSPALLLIQQIRDEAHRFAITGHRQRRDKKRRSSGLENIDGVGPKRRRELLRFFGSYKEVERASVAELMRVPTISKKVAEAIYSALHNE